MDLEERRRPSVTVEPALGFAVAALACHLLIVIWPFDFSVGAFGIAFASDGLSLFGRIGFLVASLATTAAIGVAIAFLRRGAPWTAAGVCIAVAVIVGMRLLSSVMNGLDGGAWPWQTDLVMLLDAASVVLLSLAASALRREGSAAS